MGAGGGGKTADAYRTKFQTLTADSQEKSLFKGCPSPGATKDPTCHQVDVLSLGGSTRPPPHRSRIPQAFQGLFHLWTLFRMMPVDPADVS
ncbi:unnamed protein product [Rangifer tarandus platyrhynchus]|uniref:Uncharacterized protein n=1 Tax=Rangifer tarandus platyrhynchus TaxID=3082113 RepID=A0AC59ZNI3_RANTA